MTITTQLIQSLVLAFLLSGLLQAAVTAAGLPRPANIRTRDIRA